MTWQITVISPNATAILDMPADGPGIFKAGLMRTATLTLYVAGAVPPVDRRRSVVAIPSPTYRKRK
jgi:hypothetical protein